MSVNSRIPSYTEVYTTSPTAAGLPVLEVIRRLEEEKLVSKEDRAALKDGLYSTDVARREEIVRALCEVELSMNSKFSIRRLKAIIHQNGGGEISSKHHNKPAPARKSNDAESGKANAQLNPTQTLKSEPRPSKYRTKQQRITEASDTSSGTEGCSPHSPVHSSNHNGQIGIPQPISTSSSFPSSSGAYTGSAGPMKLFPSPQSGTQSVSEKGPIRSVPSTAEPLVIHYTNNNVPMASPKTSRSREASPLRGFPNYPTGASGYPVYQPQNSQLGAQRLQGQQPNSSGHSGTVSNGATPLSQQFTPNSGRGQRPSPYRDGHHLNTTSTHNNNPLAGQGNNPGQAGGNNQNNNAPEEDFDNISTINAINQVVGPQPVYSGPDCYHNVLAKIVARFREYCAKYDAATRGKRRLAVLVGGGSFNPLTRMHLRTYFLAKQCLEAKYGYVVLGSLLSPAHSVTVRERYRTNPSEIIPSPHRLAVAQLLVQNSKLLSVDPWEITRRRAMDYLSLLDHVADIVKDQLEDVEVKVLYVCKPNMVPKLSPQALRDGNFGVVTVCRTHESDVLRNALTAKWNGVITVVEDTAILDASMDVITSRKVRDRLRQGQSVEQLVGEKIAEYAQIHHLGQKMNGLEKWEPEEKALPNLASRPAVPTLTSEINKLILQQQQQQSMSLLQQGSVASSAAGEYSPDRPLLPINELTTLNMSAHNSHHYNHQPIGGASAVYHAPSGAGKTGTGHSRHSNTSAVASNNSGYMPSWMAEGDV